MAAKELHREEAYQLLTEYTKSESLLKHALAVEAIMKAYARKFGEDENDGGMSDYCTILIMKNIRPLTITLKGGGYSRRTRPSRRCDLCHQNPCRLSWLATKSLIDKTLFAVDELSGPHSSGSGSTQ